MRPAELREQIAIEMELLPALFDDALASDKKASLTCQEVNP